MPDRLDDEIRALVTELIEASPRPPEFADVAQPQRLRQLPAGSTLLRAAGVGVTVLAVGTLGVLIGRYVLPASPSDGVATVVAGRQGPEPRFSADGLGDEVRLLPISGAVDLAPWAGGRVGDVAAVGRIEGTAVEVFTWRTREHSLDGRCVLISDASREAVCGAPVDDDRVVPRTHLHTDADGEVVGVVVTGLVPEETSVVSLESLEAGHVRVWQRPVERVAAFVIDDPSVSVASLTAWDADGKVLYRIGFGVLPGDPVTQPAQIVPLPDNHPAAVLLSDGIASAEALGAAAEDMGLNWVCSAGGRPGWELCLIYADDVLALLAFDGGPETVARYVHASTPDGLTVSMATLEPVGIRNPRLGARIQIEDQRTWVGEVSTPTPLP